jgi:hypothetical protein
MSSDGHTLELKFYGVNIEKIPVETVHTLLCPCYVLNSRLNNAGSN